MCVVKVLSVLMYHTLHSEVLVTFPNYNCAAPAWLGVVGYVTVYHVYTQFWPAQSACWNSTEVQSHTGMGYGLPV